MYQNQTQTLISLLIFLVVLVGLFVLLRSLMLWYWKIDIIIENQKQQIGLTKEQNSLLKQLSTKQGGPSLMTEEEKAKAFDRSQKK